MRHLFNPGLKSINMLCADSWSRFVDLGVLVRGFVQQRDVLPRLAAYLDKADVVAIGRQAVPQHLARPAAGKARDATGNAERAECSRNVDAFAPEVLAHELRAVDCARMQCWYAKCSIKGGIESDCDNHGTFTGTAQPIADGFRRNASLVWSAAVHADASRCGLAAWFLPKDEFRSKHPPLRRCTRRRLALL